MKREKRERKGDARFPRDLPTALSLSLLAPLAPPSLALLCEEEPPKVVEGLTRKAAAVEIYPSGMLLLARFVTRKPNGLPLFPGEQGFIELPGINAADTLLFRGVVAFIPESSAIR